MIKVVFAFISIALVGHAESVVCSSSYQNHAAQFVYSEDLSGGSILHNVNSGYGTNAWETIEAWKAIHTEVSKSQINISGRTVRVTTGKAGVVHIEAKPTSGRANTFHGAAKVYAATNTVRPIPATEYPVECIVKK